MRLWRLSCAVLFAFPCVFVCRLRGLERSSCDFDRLRSAIGSEFWGGASALSRFLPCPASGEGGWWWGVPASSRFLSCPAVGGQGRTTRRRMIFKYFHIYLPFVVFLNRRRPQRSQRKPTTEQRVFYLFLISIDSHRFSSILIDSLVVLCFLSPLRQAE